VTIVAHNASARSKISAENIDHLVSETWQTVIKKVANGHPLSSEKTLCFLFAMCLFEKVGPTLILDFENQCYGDLDGESKYLDLLFYTDSSFKVAIEFKLPKKSKSGASNQPQTREMVYRDIARLLYLKNNLFGVGACFFLMAVNEHAYLNKGSYKTHVDLKIHHGHKIVPENNMVASGLSLSGAQLEFIWLNAEERFGGRYFCGGTYAWLKPIKVYNALPNTELERTTSHGQ
jgi:hypothetical protein